MKLTNGIRISGLLLVVLALVAASPAVVRAEDALMVEDLPVVAGVVTNQIGAGLLSVNVKGKNLPAPEVLSKNPSEVRVLFPGAGLPSLTWSRDYNFPLLEGIDLEQNGEGVLMVLRTTEAVRLKKLEGRAPSRVFRFRFQALDATRVSREPLKARKFPVARPNDPLASSKPITLELRDVDIRDVFRMFGEITDMNIVADPSMPSAYVTVSLKKTPLNEAFGYIMRMYDLGYAIMGRTIIVGKKGSLGKALGKEKTRSFRVAYAEPAKAAALLQGLSGVEKVVVDERLRMIYVTAAEDEMYDVERVLQRVDHPGQQVLLQARIVEVTDSGKKALENTIDALYKKWAFSYNPESGQTQVGYTYNSALANPTVKALDTALSVISTKSEGKVLASPSVVTLDGEEAEVKLIQKLKYQSGIDEDGNPEFEDEEVGPTLTFTPVVGRENMVTVEVEIKTGEIIQFRSSGSSEVPETSERSAETTVRVRNGEPFVIGGLFKDSDTTSLNRIPVLADIPLLGGLFESESKNKERSEVVMILIPYILEMPNGAIEVSTL